MRGPRPSNIDSEMVRQMPPHSGSSGGAGFTVVIGDQLRRPPLRARGAQAVWAARSPLYRDLRAQSGAAQHEAGRQGRSCRRRTIRGVTKHVEVSRDIKASPMAVWSAVSDVTRMGEWSPECHTCAWAEDATGPAVGARFVGHNRNG